MHVESELSGSRALLRGSSLSRRSSWVDWAPENGISITVSYLSCLSKQTSRRSSQCIHLERTMDHDWLVNHGDCLVVGAGFLSDFLASKAE